MFRIWKPVMPQKQGNVVRPARRRTFVPSSFLAIRTEQGQDRIIEVNHSETTAKRVFETLLPGTMDYRSRQSHGECDFELRYDNGTTAAVEVTALVDQRHAQTLAAIRSKKKGGSCITATKCKKNWFICPAEHARIEKIRESADDYLSRVEEARIEKFSCVRDWDIKCIQELCRDLKVTNGWVIPTNATPTIRIVSPIGGSGGVGPGIAIEAGEQQAWKKDNRKKLGAARATETHLVVHIDAQSGLPWLALVDFEPSPALPNLPEELTHLWLLGHEEEPNQYVVWHASTREPWSSLRIRETLIKRCF